MPLRATLTRSKVCQVPSSQFSMLETPNEKSDEHFWLHIPCSWVCFLRRAIERIRFQGPRCRRTSFTTSCWPASSWICEYSRTQHRPHELRCKHSIAFGVQVRFGLVESRCFGETLTEALRAFLGGVDTLPSWSGFGVCGFWS
jgi:hypothetical protein